MGKTKVEALAGVSNGAASIIEMSRSYRISITIEGVADFLFHRYNCESVEEKGKAAKGSKAKKEDDIQSYVARDDKGHLAIPGEYFRQSILHAAKFVADPRSPRKSARDLFNAGIVCHTEFASLGKKDWDYLDKRRVVIKMSAVPRVRPALLKGWRATFVLEVLLPEYIGRDLLLQTAGNAGRLIGVGDFRPSYGRFVVVDVAD